MRLHRNRRYLSILSELCIFNTFSAADIVYKAIIRDIAILPFIYSIHSRWYTLCIPLLVRGQKVNFCSIIAFSLILIIETIRGTYARSRKDERNTRGISHFFLPHDSYLGIPQAFYQVSDPDSIWFIDPRGRWKWAKNDRLWTTYPTFDGSSTFKSINWSSIGLVDPLNCFWTKLWVSYSSNNAIQNHLNCFIKHFHVSQVWFYPPITQSKFNFQNTKKNSLKIF